MVFFSLLLTVRSNIWPNVDRPTKRHYFHSTVETRTLRTKHIIILPFRSEMAKRKSFSVLCFLMTKASQLPNRNEPSERVFLKVKERRPFPEMEWLFAHQSLLGGYFVNWPGYLWWVDTTHKSTTRVWTPAHWFAWWADYLRSWEVLSKLWVLIKVCASYHENHFLSPPRMTPPQKSFLKTSLLALYTELRDTWQRHVAAMPSVGEKYKTKGKNPFKGMFLQAYFSKSRCTSDHQS